MENNKFGTNQLYGPQTFLGNTSSRSNHNTNLHQQQQQQLLNQHLYQHQYLYQNQSQLQKLNQQQPQPQSQPFQQQQQQTNQHQLNNGNKNRSSPNIPKDVLIPKWLPKCGYCDKLILEEQCTEAEEKVWHLKCFKCFECKKTLGGQQYVMARPTVLRSNETTFNPESEYPYCLACFDAFFAELCEECGDIIGCEIGSIKHEGRHWHANEACFKCNFCKSALLGKLFLPANDGKIYCSAQCYQYILKMYRPSTTREKTQSQPPPPLPPPLPPSLSTRLNPTTIPSSSSSSSPSSVQLPAQVSLSSTNQQPSPPTHPHPHHHLQQQLPHQHQTLPKLQPTQLVPISTTPVPQERTTISREQSTDHSSVLKPHSSSPSSSSESTPLLTRTSTLINDKPDVIQNYLISPEEEEKKKDEKEKVTKESSPSTPPITTTIIDSAITQEKEILSSSSSLPIKVSTNDPNLTSTIQKICPKSVTFDPSVKENESNRKCRSVKKVIKDDDCCSTCSSHSSSSSDDEFDYDLMDARRRQWIAGTRIHYVAATAQPTSSSSSSTLPKTKNRSKSNDSNHSKTKTLHRPIKRFQDCSLNWAEILRSKLKGR
ncbi:protein prickle-like [Panonychus citri]|uniref:protein prickle-like n=1 Tax=Panonychus citri TaxID=50023 RepID=UPI002306F42B|nr:protein prickle-like [Panonychus citri]XP_053213616.1 protein prickle-like [Panonychus citri]